MIRQSLDWLLESDNPAVRFHTMHDIQGRSLDDPAMKRAREKIIDYAPVRKLLRLQNGEGYWPPKDTCYTPKWTSTVWPLMLLGEMGVPANERVKSACERFLGLHQWRTGSFVCPSRFDRFKGKNVWEGWSSKVWDEPCLTGNMIRTLLVLGYENDPRVKRAIDWMPEQQLEDGGWNCDYPEKKVKHSSFMSTVEPLWAYSEIPRSRWTRKMKRTVDRGAEFLLMHRVYKSDHHHWKHSLPFATTFHFPMYYFYDALHGLRVLSKLGYADDERVRDAAHLIISKRSPDGKWLLEGDWSREPDAQKNKRKALVEIEELWEPSKWITLNACRVLTSTGDVQVKA